MRPRQQAPLVTLAALAATACALAGCADRADRGNRAAADASEFPEAALVDLLRAGQLGAYCSGALIAPAVVLTAGHCVTGQRGFEPDAWSVVLPNAGHQRVQATGAATYDWQTTDGHVDPGRHDIGLLFLARAVHLGPGQCPRLSTAPLRDDSEVVHVGRFHDGRLSTTSVFVGAAVPVSDGARAGFPFDYDADAVLTQGDSGGPVVADGAAPHLIVAVGSGASPGKNEVLARVDLLNSASNQWIAEQVRDHGGPCREAL